MMIPPTPDTRTVIWAPSLTMQGPSWKICIELAYLPQASLDWWRHLIRVTKDAFCRRKWLDQLLGYIQTPHARTVYKRLIPENADAKRLYRIAHGDFAVIPSEYQLTLFEKRLPKIVKLLEDELNKY